MIDGSRIEVCSPIELSGKLKDKYENRLTYNKNTF